MTRLHPALADALLGDPAKQPCSSCSKQAEQPRKKPSAADLRLLTQQQTARLNFQEGGDGVCASGGQCSTQRPAPSRIAPDEGGCIIGEPITQEGCLAVPAKTLGLCMGVTNAAFRTTTEVYPDSPRVTEDECNRAQVAAVRAALDFVIREAL